VKTVSSEADQLLYVLTAKREISWSAYKAVVDEIFRATPTFRKDVASLRGRILRLFDALGFCDLSFRQGAGRVFVAPATLVRLPLQGCSAILVGARGPTTFEDLSTAARGGTELSLHLDDTEENGLLPSRITVDASHVEELARLSSRLKIPFEPQPACWKLSQFSADIESYERTLQWTDGPDLNWKSWHFDPEYIEFREQSDPAMPIRLVRYLDPVKNIPRYRLWRNKSYAEIDLDWGRYIVLRESGFNVLYYDPHHHRIAVPRSASLPRLLQRAIGLSSGLMPMTYRLREGTGSRKAWDLFQLVPSQVAEMVCKKVGQSLSTFSLN
jgi:hypothetical protein